MSDQKIALVTGGSRGIGRNTVVSLAKRNINSIFTYHTHREDADAVLGAVKAEGAQAIALELDAGNVKALDGFVARVEKALSQWGPSRFDYLVNNAGNNHRNMLFDKVTEEEFDNVLNVHFKGVF